MAEIIVKNIGEFNGNYNDEPITFSTNEVSTTIVTGITATKVADKELWVNGPLNYTITMTNESGVELTDLVFIDTLDHLVVNFDQEYGVFVNDTTTPFTYYSDILSVNLPAIAAGGSVNIQFRVFQA